MLDEKISPNKSGILKKWDASCSRPLSNPFTLKKYYISTQEVQLGVRTNAYTLLLSDINT